MVKVGIVGISGRVGGVIADFLRLQGGYEVGKGYCRKVKEGTWYVVGSLKEVLEGNDYIVDFSSFELTEVLFKALLEEPRPLIFGTSGIDFSVGREKELLRELSQKVPIVLVPNVSVSAYVHKVLTMMACLLLGEDYDISLLEEHHRNKLDDVSGTAYDLLEAIKGVKKELGVPGYRQGPVASGGRQDRYIEVASFRHGGVIGKHVVKWIGEHEGVHVVHEAYSRLAFAKGVKNVLDWLEGGVLPGVYDMGSVLGVQDKVRFLGEYFRCS